MSTASPLLPPAYRTPSHATAYPAPSHSSTRRWAFVQILISVSLLASLLADIGELREARKNALNKMKMLEGSLDIEMMQSLDKNGDGVDKCRPAP